MPAAAKFAEFATELQLQQIPAAVQTAARMHLLDALGCGIAAVGSGEGSFAQTLVADDHPGPATVIGCTGGRAPELAALANGISIHALDFDDTHSASICHVSAVVLPAALAAIEAHGGKLGDLLAALIVGNEVTCRVGMSAGDGFHLRGLHPTAICGVFGATAAVGRIAGLNAATITNALGIAGSMAAGLLAYLADGSSTKRIHPGWMAHSAQLAARLAAAGGTGPATVIEGHNGIYQALLGRHDLTVPTADLGSGWQTPLIAFKPYPACHFIHAALDAADSIRRARNLAWDDVDAITVLAPQAAIDMVLEPLARKRAPTTSYEAKFSTPFALGALMVYGQVDVTTFGEQMLADERILAVARRVDYRHHDFPTFPQSFPGGIIIRSADGNEEQAIVEHQRGGEHAPLADTAVIAKYRTNAATALAAAASAQIERLVIDGALADDIAPLALLGEARPAQAAAIT